MEIDLEFKGIILGTILLGLIVISIIDWFIDNL